MQHFIRNSFNFLPKASPRSVKQYWKRASVWIVQCRGQEKSLKLLHWCRFSPLEDHLGVLYVLFLCCFLAFIKWRNKYIIVFVLRDHGRNGSKHSYSRMVAEDRVQSLFNGCIWMHTPPWSFCQGCGWGWIEKAKTVLLKCRLHIRSY